MMVVTGQGGCSFGGGAAGMVVSCGARMRRRRPTVPGITNVCGNGGLDSITWLVFVSSLLRELASLSQRERRRVMGGDGCCELLNLTKSSRQNGSGARSRSSANGSPDNISNNLRRSILWSPFETPGLG